MRETLVNALKKEKKPRVAKVVVKEDKQVPTKLSPGVYGIVDVNGNMDGTGESEYMKEYKKKGYPVLVADDVYGYYKDSNRMMVTFSPCEIPIPNGTSPNQTYIYPRAIVRPISKKVALETIADMKIRAIAAEAQAIENFRKLIPARIPIARRDDYDKLKRDYLNTNENFVQLVGNFDYKTSEIKGVVNYPHAVCCALTKTNVPIIVNIPNDWISYFGYNVTDLKKWLEFLKACEIGFDYKYLGKTTLESEFTDKNIATKIPKMARANMFVSPKMDIHRILIVPPNQNVRNMQNYMRFLLVRYIYNNQYWNIPTIAMQIKGALKGKVTNWEALMLAHMNDYYYDYYCMVSNNGNGTGAIALPKSENSPQNIVSKLGVTENVPAMVRTFTYDSNIKLADSVRAAIRSKDWNAIEGYINDWRKIKS